MSLLVTGEEEDRVTAGGWIQNALFSQRASPGRRWNDWPGTDGIGGVFSVHGLCSEMEYTGFRSDKVRLLNKINKATGKNSFSKRTVFLLA